MLNLKVLLTKILTELKNNKTNKVLWSSDSGWYMNDQHTITLSEKVSDQQHGIVLAWSYFDGSTGQNDDWVYHFVPKYHVQAHEGTGVDFVLGTNNTYASKYLYVWDSQLKGHAGNQQSGTGSNSGTKYKNTYWVLRYVIGV